MIDGIHGCIFGVKPSTTCSFGSSLAREPGSSLILTEGIGEGKKTTQFGFISLLKTGHKTEHMLVDDPAKLTGINSKKLVVQSVASSKKCPSQTNHPYIHTYTYSYVILVQPRTSSSRSGT